MSESSAKRRVLEAIEKLPNDATEEDAIERLVFLARIERGLTELDKGNGVAHAEVERRLEASISRPRRAKQLACAAVAQHGAPTRVT